MKKSLFTKLMTTFIIVLVLSYSLVAVFLSYKFNSFYYSQKETELLHQAVNLRDSNSVIKEYFKYDTDKSKLQSELQSLGNILDAKIEIVDKYGFPQDYSGEGRDKIMQTQIRGSVLEDFQKGNSFKSEGNFMNQFSSTMVTVGVPVTQDDVFVGGLLLHSPIDDIQTSIKWVLFAIWLSAFFAVIISAFIIYYFAEKILIKPLATINQTAKSISTGEFNKRVDIKSDDEIGDLAVSFNYMADSLQGLENMRKSFIANVSHELRSPMTSINGFISGIIDGTIPEEKWLHYLNIVHDEIKRLIRLINDILDLASLESGEFSLHAGTFDINELIRQRVIKFEDKINKKDINMDVVLIGNKIKVNGDRDRIDQVITNLIDNAIKFVPEGGIIEIHTEIKDDRMLVSIYNNGSGIPKDEIKYVWDRFHKADKARSKGGGTGLGLSIARQIVNQHKQNIWVDSGEDWTKFTFTLSIV